LTPSAQAGAYDLAAICSLEDTDCGVLSSDNQCTTSTQLGYFTTPAEWYTQTYISESSWGNLTNVPTHSNFRVGSLTKVSSHSNFRMGSLTKVSTHSNFRMSNLTKVSTYLNFYVNNLTKTSIHLNFHMNNLAIQPHPAGYNESNLSTDYVPLSHGCYNPHLTLLMLLFCTEKADFVQSIYQIYSFVTGHVYKLFLWINQSIPCTITNFADRYSEILNWISYLNIISELPCWSISELVLSTHQNMMYQQDFVALKIRLYCYALKKQYKCKSYS